MKSLRYCRSCSGPRPRAARRCPWCQRDYDQGVTQPKPEHLFAIYDRILQPPPVNKETCQ